MMNPDEQREAFENPSGAAYRHADWAGHDATPDHPDYRYFLAQVQDQMPGASPETVAVLALHLTKAHHAPWDQSSDNGSAANARADVGDASGLTRYARLADMAPGDADALRAIHAWLKADQDDAPNHAPAPDSYTGQQHTVVKTRSRSGVTSLKITRRGVAQVQGSWRPWWASRIDRTRATSTDLIICRWIERHQSTRAGDVRRMTYGSNAIDVARATRARYGSDQVDRLIGTDVQSYAEPPLPSSERVDWFGRHQDIGGYATTHALREVMTVGTRDENGDRDHFVSGWAVTDTPGLEWSTRYKLPAVKARKSEGATASRLIAPSATPGRVFIGHRCIDRGATARKRTVKLARTVDAWSITTATDVADLTERLSHLAPGMRVTLTIGAYEGSLTCNGKAKAKRYNLRLTDDQDHTIKLDGARSIARVLDVLPI